jgi:hypothetical protein
MDRKQHSYAGAVMGGPWGGVFYAGRASSFAVPRRATGFSWSTPRADGNKPVRIERHIYHWETLFPHIDGVLGFWRHESLDAEECRALLLHLYGEIRAAPTQAELAALVKRAEEHRQRKVDGAA